MNESDKQLIWIKYYQELFDSDSIPCFELRLYTSPSELHEARICLITTDDTLRTELRQRFANSTNPEPFGSFVYSYYDKYVILLIEDSNDYTMSFTLWHEITHMLNYDEEIRKNPRNYLEVFSDSEYTSFDEYLAYYRSYYASLCSIESPEVVKRRPDLQAQIIQMFENIIKNNVFQETDTYLCYNIQKICGFATATQHLCGIDVRDYLPPNVYRSLEHFQSLC